MMEKFMVYLKESTITTAILTLISVGAVIYLSIVGQPVPELLEYFAMFFVGALAGGKVENVKMSK